MLERGGCRVFAEPHGECSSIWPRGHLNDQQQSSGVSQSMLELLAMPGIEDLEFDVPIMSEFFRPAEFF